LRLKIREVLERQRIHSLDRSASQQLNLNADRPGPFGPAGAAAVASNRNLWVFR
jgi:hypothetical protein